MPEPLPAATGRRRWLPGGDLGSFRRQLTLTTALLSAIVAVVLVVVVRVTLATSAHDSVNRVLAGRADAVVSSAESATRGRRLVVPDADIDPGVAVYDGRGRLVAGSVPPSQRHEYQELGRTRTARTLAIGETFELRGEPFRTSSGATGVVVVSERLDPYEDDVDDALGVSVAAGLLIVVLATALAGWASRRALAPVGQMARVAEEWSEHSLERRFDLGEPTNEIKALGHTLDSLLARVHRVILDEQRLTSELAHELRTPLAGVLAIAELVELRTDLDETLRSDMAEIVAACRQMATTITGLLDLARSHGSGDFARDGDLGDVVAAVSREQGNPPRLRVLLPTPIRIAVAPELAARAIGPVVENAVRIGKQVQVSAHLDGRWVEVIVADDGPGVDRAHAEAIFEPGRSGSGSSGLGLALARRVARSVGGDVTVRIVDGVAGSTFVVRLPLAAGD